MEGIEQIVERIMGDFETEFFTAPAEVYLQAIDLMKADLDGKRAAFIATEKARQE